MIKNYFKPGIRSLLRNKAFSTINISGLAIGMAAFLLIMHYVQYERSYESFNKNADNVYRVTLDLYNGSQFEVTDCETHPPFGPAIKAKLPEVEEFVRIQRMEQIREVSYLNRQFLEEKIYAVDPSIFNVFGLELIKGDINTVLKNPMQVVITESMARKYFGKAEVVGKSLKVKPYKERLEIVGVIKDIPLNTHLKMDFLISFISLKTWGWDLNSWNGNNNYTYLQLSPNTQLSKFNEKLKAFSKTRFNKNIVVAEPVKNIHLYSNKTFEPEINGNAQTVNFLLIIAILIILIVSINYINLTTAKSIERAREIGIRKIIGSSKTEIIIQSVVEFILINIFATGFALILIYLTSPFYPEIIGKDIPVNLLQTGSFWKSLGLLFLINIVLSGLYPALILSATKPISVITKKFTASPKGSLLRKALVVGQFAITFILISGTIIIYKQVQYMKSQNLGMTTEEVLVVRAPAIGDKDSTGRLTLEVFKNRLKNISGITEVSASESLPGVSLHELNTSNVVQFGTKPTSAHTYYMYGIDSLFVPLMNIQMAAGTNFSSRSSGGKEAIVNEEAARLLGFKSAEEAIGRKITIGDNAAIVGVVKNYNQQSLKEKHLPMIHWYGGSVAYVSLKVSTADLKNTIKQVEQTWSSTLPEYFFDYYFLDEMFDQQYKADMQFGKTIAVFSGIAIFLACLGLLGLVSYSTQQRTKEIGIRKVLGATIANIATLLTNEYVKLVALSIIIASPLAWYAISSWLQGFENRININQNTWIFFASGSLALAIALLTVSFQAVKAALANPVKSLRTE